MRFNKLIILLLSLLSIIHKTRCFPTMNNPRILYEGTPAPDEFFLIFGAILIAVIMRYITQKLHLSLPPPLFMIITGALWGIGLIYDNETINKYSSIIRVHPSHLIAIIMPTIVFQATFCLDAHTLVKSWFQVTMISVFAMLISSLIVGLLMTCFVISKHWSYLIGILFGVCSWPIDSTGVNGQLRLIGQRTKRIRTLLEGETVLNIGTSMLAFYILLGAISGYIDKWHEACLIFVRYVGGGIGMGLIFGQVTSKLFNRFRNDMVNVASVTIVFPFVSYYVCEEVLFMSGVLCVTVIGLMLSVNRSALTVEMDTFLCHFWEILALLMNIIIFLTAGILFTATIVPYMDTRDYLLILMVYILSYIGRFLGFILLAPILSRTGYGLNFRDMVIIIWGGLKCSVSICLVMVLYDTPTTFNIGRHFLMYTVGLITLSLFINGLIMPVLLKQLGLTQLTMAQQSNMTSCMKFILAQRNRIIGTLKMDRSLSDANWPIITQTTDLKHPYKLDLKGHDDEEHMFLGYRVTVCPDCRQEILNEPTAKQFEEMTKEAKMKILKAKRVFYSRQYENGMLTRDGMRVLSQAIDIALDTNQTVNDLDSLYKLFTPKPVYSRNLRCLDCLCKRKQRVIKPPRKPCRYKCYKLVKHINFEIAIYVIILSNIIPATLDMVYRPNPNSVMYYCLKGINTIYTIIYLGEFIIKIYAYSFIYIWKHGVKTYFLSFWNIFDFIVLCTTLVDIVLDYVELFSNFDKSGHASNVTIAARLMRLLRCLRLLRMFSGLYPRLVQHFKAQIDNDIAFAYDVGKGFMNGEQEVAQMLSQMIDNPRIIENAKNEIEFGRLAITKQLTMVQNERPWIGITVKTKQAIQSVLNSMKEAINELKMSGSVDEDEYIRLIDSLNERVEMMKTIKKVKPNDPKVMFNEVPWMAGDQNIIEYLYEKATLLDHNTSTDICADGALSEGVHVVISGIGRLIYMPNHGVLNECMEFGRLPIVDYLSTTKFDAEIGDYIVAGNCFGKLSTLTGRRYNCSITAETPCQTLFISASTIKNAMQISNDPIHGLEARIWKSIGVRISIPILMDTPAYQSETKTKIQYQLERSFVPNLRHFKTFFISDSIEDVILIEGIAVDFHTREWYNAPCYIPRTVQKLILPKSSQVNINRSVETKLLIIPSSNVEEYDIFDGREQMAEMINTSSARCMLHLIKERLKKKKRRRRGRKVGSRASNYSGSTTKSRLTLVSSAETEIVSNVVEPSRRSTSTN